MLKPVKKSKRDREELKKKFLEIYLTQPVSMLTAALKSGIGDRVTIWRWRKEDPEFDRAIVEASARQDEIRVKAVEDGLFERLMSGTATSAETIFFLANRAPHRWRHVQTIKAEHSLEQNGKAMSFADLLKMAKEEAKETKETTEAKEDNTTIEVGK